MMVRLLGKEGGICWEECPLGFSLASRPHSCPILSICIIQISSGKFIRIYDSQTSLCLVSHDLFKLIKNILGSTTIYPTVEPSRNVSQIDKNYECDRLVIPNGCQFKG